MSGSKSSTIIVLPPTTAFIEDYDKILLDLSHSDMAKHPAMAPTPPIILVYNIIVTTGILFSLLSSIIVLHRSRKQYQSLKAQEQSTCQKPTDACPRLSIKLVRRNKRRGSCGPYSNGS